MSFENRRPFNEVVQLITALQNKRGPVLAQMKEILDRYDGDWIIPVPSVSSEPVLPPLTPALIGEAVDSKARLAASVRPTIFCPAIDPSKDTGKRSRQFALTRRKIIAATYDRSRWQLGRRRFYRQLSAYETGSICVVPNFDTEMPSIEVRDALGTFVEDQAFEQLRDPEYVGFVNRHSGSHLRGKFPAVRSEGGGPITAQDEHELWDVVEWYDLDQLVFGLVGPVKGGPHVNDRPAMNAPWMQLSPAMPNKLGLLPCVVPHNVSLGRVASRVGTMLGNVDVQAKLMALDIIAQEKAIFPDMYAIGRQNGMPAIIGGRWKDGREGDMNILSDIEQVGMLRNTPDQRTSQTIDRLERNLRISTGLLPQTGGESFSALRTGRAMDSMFAASIDPIVQEMHEISEAYLPLMNSAILAMYKAYWPDQKYTLFSGWPSDRGIVEFTPDLHIESLENSVAYSIAGADVVQTTQVLGSLMGAGAISRATFRSRHPLIDDPEAEGRLADEEQFEEALKQSIIQKIMSGEMPDMVAVKIRNHMAEGEDIFKAVALVNAELQELQAQQPAAPPPGMLAAPEAMPGLAAGPSAAQAPMPEPEPQVEVPGDVSRMRQLMQVMGGT